jgi:osmotically-inducible protein OsmY
VDATQIKVAVYKGVVTLTGVVSSYFGKWNADDAVRRINGVIGLLNEAKVVIDTHDRHQDPEIERSVGALLAWTAAVPKGTLRASVADGWVTLTGAVDWQYQKTAAVSGIRNLRGVTGVTNNVAVKQELTVGAIKADIEAALKRSAATDARNIHVELNGSDVTLTGTVHNWAERSAATDSVWAAPGVATVTDHLTLTF